MSKFWGKVIINLLNLTSYVVGLASQVTKIRLGTDGRVKRRYSSEMRILRND